MYISRFGIIGLAIRFLPITRSFRPYRKNHHAVRMANRSQYLLQLGFPFSAPHIALTN
jgi:hypothetical protein